MSKRFVWLEESREPAFCLKAIEERDSKCLLRYKHGGECRDQQQIYNAVLDEMVDLL